MAFFVLAFFVLAENAQAQCDSPPDPPTNDREVLIKLYCDTDGNNWTNNDNWVSGPDIDTWHGVILSGSEITKLDLHINNLSGEIPTELGDLTNLERLRLDSNNLSGEIPTEFGELTSLRNLYLDRNNLSGEIPTELGKLTSLQALYLNDNNLSGEISTELGKLTSLQALYLNDNNLSGEIPTELGKLTSLRNLNLSSNELSGEIPTELGELTNFGTLYLNDNNLSGEIPTEFGELTSLRYLYLSNNELSGEIPTEFGELTSLRYLYLFSNKLSGEIPTELAASLWNLNLSSNELSGEIPTELGGLTSLQALYLHSNQLTGAIPELSALTNLYSLYVNNNQLTGSVPAELGNLFQLRELGYWGNEMLTWDDVSDELGKRVDRAVLRGLYDTNGGEEWTNNDNWFLSDEAPADIFSFSLWYGVSADAGTGRVSGLDLSSNGLKGGITNALEASGGLTDLDIAGNGELAGELPLRLKDLSLLNTLDISCTGVSVPADTDFQTWLSGISFQKGCTLSKVTGVSVVAGVRVVAGVEELSVSWNQVSGADGYKVQWKSGTQSFDSSRQRTVGGSTTSYTIRGLAAGVRYKVRVTATRSGAQDGQPSDEAVGTPAAPQPPSQPPGETPPSGGGGGCTIVSEGLPGNTFAGTVFNLLLIMSVPLAVFLRNSSDTRGT